MAEAISYSKTEHQVGYWIDGKPLYQKLIEWCSSYTLYPTDTIIDIPVGILIDTLVQADIITKGNHYNNAEVSNSYYQQARLTVSARLFSFKMSVSYSIDKGYLLIKYTKQ